MHVQRRLLRLLPKNRKAKQIRLHAHPVQAVTYLLKYAYLFLIPLLRQLLYEPANVLQKLYSSITNLILGGLILFLIYLRWRTIYVAWDENTLLFERGILPHRKKRLPFYAVDALYQESGLIQYLFGVCRFRAESAADKSGGPLLKKNKGSDISLYLSRKKAARAFLALLPDYPKKRLFRPTGWSMLGMAVFWSNAASGLFLLAPFARQAVEILGQELSAKFYDRLDFRLYLVNIGIPPIAAGMAWIFLGGWLAALLTHWIRHVRFSCYYQGDFFLIESGVFLHQKQAYRKNSIRAVTARQTLAMRIFGAYSACFHIAGAGKKEKSTWILPMTRRSTFFRFAGAVFSRLPATPSSFPLPEKTLFSPPVKAMRRYLTPSLIQIGLLTSFMVLLSLTGGSATLIFLTLFPLFLAGWHMLVRILEFRSCFLQVIDGCVTLCHAKGFSLLTTVFPAANLQEFRFQQSLFQKKAGLCTVTLWLKGDQPYRMKLRHLSVTDFSFFKAFLQK